MKLYDIPTAWQAILTAIEDGCGEITPELDAQAQDLISASKEKVEAAGLAMRNLEIQAALATQQAQVFQTEAARCAGMAKAFAAAADRIGALMVPALQITGKVKTPAGTLYTRTNQHWAFELKPGVQFFALDESLWRQKEPELNKLALTKLAKEGHVPEEIIALKTETTSAYLKTPKDLETAA